MILIFNEFYQKLKFCKMYSDYSYSSDDDFFSHEEFFTKDVDSNSPNDNRMKYPPLNLLQDSNDLSILKYLPCNFELKTNNTSSKFNLDLLICTSRKIYELIRKNANIFSYYLNVDDPMNILKKFELMYQGKKVFFEKRDQQISEEIARLLELNSPIFNDSLFQSPEGIIASTKSFSTLLRNEKYRNFIISTKTHKYMCNSYTIYFSDVIKDMIIKDPTIHHFEYDFDDEFGQFQTVCSLFNLETIEPTKNNIYFLKEIAEDLKITKILPIINDIINNFENDSKVINEQQKMVDSIEELFGWLYNIENLKIETVKDLIVDSFWSKKEDDVRELAAFIIHVIKTNYLIHSSITDLLILLQKESDETNSLDILIPSIISYLMPIMSSKINYCSFFYNLHKKGIISEEDLIEDVRIQYELSLAKLRISKFKSFNQYNLLIWFFPELIEKEIIDMDCISHFEDENNYDSEYEEEDDLFYRNKSIKSDILKDFISYYNPDKIDQYKNMRNKGEPDDELTKSLINDDVDKLQSIVTNSKIDFTKRDVPINIYSEQKRGKFKQYSLINYAAMFGSIKCFKYLLLNHAEINKNTFPCAIKGGNIEIIKIADEKSSKINSDDSIDAIKLTIKNHQNDLFDWILENKYANKLNFEIKSKLLKKSVKYGNAHSFIEIMNTGFDFKDFLQSFINISAKNGFYRFFKLIIALNGKEAIDQIIIDEKNHEFPFISFGNLSIFKLSLELTNTKRYIEKTLSFAIKKDYRNIIDYILSNLINKVFKISEHGAYEALKYSIQTQSIELINSLWDKFISQCPSMFIGFEKLTNLLKIACNNKQIDLVQRLTEIILINNPNEDFSDQFKIAASVESFEICNYFINKKVFINTKKLTEFVSLNVEFFSLIKNSFPGIQIQTNEYLLSDAIKSHNKELVDYLLKNGAPIKNCLFLAVLDGYLDIVDIILKYYNEPSIVNKNSKDGTILHVAIDRSDVQMVKRILKIPGIDPLLYNNEMKSALYMAILSKNMEIIEEILDFLGQRISEKKIIDEISKSTIDLISLEKNILTKEKKKYFRHYFRRFFSKKVDQVDKNNIILILKRVLQIKGIDPNVCGPKYTFLLYSCEIGEIEIVKMLLEMDNIDVNAYSHDDGNTPLITSIIYNNVDIALLLINDKRTDINLNNFNDETALTIAVQDKLTKVVSFLIKNEKFDPDKSHLNFAFYESFGKISTQLSSLKSLDVNYYYNNQTTLTNAVNNYNYEKIDLIVNHPSFDKDKSQFKKAVSILIQRSNIKEFKNIFNALKFDINISIDSRSILSIAVEYQSFKIVKCILQNPNFDSKKSDILDAFLRGLSNICDKHKNKLREYDKQSKQSSPDDSEDFILVHKNIKKNSSENSEDEIFVPPKAKQSFSENSENDVFVPQKAKQSFSENSENDVFVPQKAKQLFSEYSENDVFVPPKAKQLFSEYSENDVFVPQKAKQSSSYDSDDVISVHKNIKSISSEEYSEDDVFTIDDILNELFEFDKKHDKLIDMKKLLPNGKSFFTYKPNLPNARNFVKYLIDHGADPNKPDKDGVYPLEYAISTGNTNFVLALIDLDKIDLNIKTIMKPKKPDIQPTEKNETLLHLAAKIDNSDILKLFLNMKSFDINAIDDSGETPLIKACRYGIKENVKLLFKNNKLNYLHRNNEGKDALEILSSFYINKKNESKIEDKNIYMKQLLYLIELNNKDVKCSSYDGSEIDEYQ